MGSVVGGRHALADCDKQQSTKGEREGWGGAWGKKGEAWKWWLGLWGGAHNIFN